MENIGNFALGVQERITDILDCMKVSHDLAIKRAAHLIAAKQYHERVKAKQQCREEEAKKNGT